MMFLHHGFFFNTKSRGRDHVMDHVDIFHFAGVCQKTEAKGEKSKNPKWSDRPKGSQPHSPF